MEVLNRYTVHVKLLYVNYIGIKIKKSKQQLKICQILKMYH